MPRPLMMASSRTAFVASSVKAIGAKTKGRISRKEICLPTYFLGFVQKARWLVLPWMLHPAQPDERPVKRVQKRKNPLHTIHI